MNAPLKAISVKFHALPTSRNITQDFAMRASTVCITEQAKEYPEGLTIISVYVDGLPCWTVPTQCSKDTPDGLPFTMSVRPPLLQQGERVEVSVPVPFAGIYSTRQGARLA